MKLKDLQKEDLDAVFFDPDNGIAEPATYNGTSVDVLPEIGSTGVKGNVITMEGTADRAVFGIKVSDINNPKPGDKIVHDAKTWYVSNMVSTDGVLIRLACVGNESVYGK